MEILSRIAHARQLVAQATAVLDALERHARGDLAARDRWCDEREAEDRRRLAVLAGEADPFS